MSIVLCGFPLKYGFIIVLYYMHTHIREKNKKVATTILQGGSRIITMMGL